MASKPPIECPVCREVLDEDHDLETHLMRSHRRRELAAFVVANYEADLEGDFT